MEKRYLKIIIAVVIVLLAVNIPITLYLGSFCFHTFSQKHKQEEPNITKSLFDYLRYDKTQNFIEDESFNEREKTHLLDVKNLIQKFIRIKNISILSLFILVALLALSKKPFLNLSKGILAGSILTIVIFLVFFFLDFSSLFEGFHSIFFKAGTWLFSQEDRLIMLFPLEFFRDITTRIALTAVSAAVILFIPSFYWTYKLRHKQVEKQKK